MLLKSVYIRFYKSFNHDYVRKLNQMDKSKGITPEPWEFVNDVFFPHIKVDLDNQITTIVGANESGKSHLLSAIEKARYGEQEKYKITREDFCRYSQFFDSVENNVPRYSDIGLHFHDLTPDEVKQLKSIFENGSEKSELDSGNNVDFNNLYFFRYHNSTALYFPLKHPKVSKQSRASKKSKGKQNPKTLEQEEPNLTLREQAESRFLIIKNPKKFPENFLPPVFRIKSDIPLPGEIFIDDLLDGKMDENIQENKNDSFSKNRNLLTIYRNQNRLVSVLDRLSNYEAVDQVTFTEEEIEEFNQLSEELKSDDGFLDKDKLIPAVKGFNLVLSQG